LAVTFLEPRSERDRNLGVIRTLVYGDSLAVFPSVFPDMEAYDSLESGQMVYVRIKDEDAQGLLDGGLVFIVAMRADSEMLLTIEDYQEFMIGLYAPLTRLGAILAVLSLPVNIICIWQLLRASARAKRANREKGYDIYYKYVPTISIWAPARTSIGCLTSGRVHFSC